MMQSTLLFAGYNLFYGAVHPMVDNSAHIGGFVTGIVLGWVTAMPPDPGRRSELWTRKAFQAAGVTMVMVTVGVYLAPRFDYSPQDRLAWSDAVAGIDTREAPLLARQDSALARWHQSTAHAAELGRVIDDELVPFYAGYQHRLEALRLKTGRATERNREIVVRALDLKVQGLQHLSRGVKDGDNAEMLASERSESESEARLRTIKQEP
jgi:Rhomboid family